MICTSVHPSGGLLLSIGGDNTLRFWNLIKGRQAYAINLSKKISPGNTLNVVKWSKDGDYYSVAIGRKVEIYLVKTAALVYEAECPVRISSMDFSEVECWLSYYLVKSYIYHIFIFSFRMEHFFLELMRDLWSFIELTQKL